MIKLKTLLENINRRVDDPDFDIYYLSRQISKIAAKFGETVIGQLGDGWNGIAWRLGNGKVLKITNDKREIVAVSRLRTRALDKHIISYYDIRQITDFMKPGYEILTTPTSEWYAIIMNYVTPLNTNQKQWWKVHGHLYLNTTY